MFKRLKKTKLYKEIKEHGIILFIMSLQLFNIESEWILGFSALIFMLIIYILCVNYAKQYKLGHFRLSIIFLSIMFLFSYICYKLGIPLFK